MSSRASKYSNTEQSVLALLPDDGTRLNTNELVAMHYGRRRPLNANKVIVGVMRGLMRKSVRNKEKFRIKKGRRQGPRPMEFWMEKKQ